LVQPPTFFQFVRKHHRQINLTTTPWRQ